MSEKARTIWLILITIFQLSMSERRIKGGQEIKTDKRYAVYLLKAADAPIMTPDWTCGGTIVSRSFVVTAAACVLDLQRVYVISGYRKFVTSTEIDEDQCTSKMKKRVILVCMPKEYELKYDKTEHWTRIDIAVLKVETPFNFTDTAYTEYCSYMPTHIQVNYWPKYQEPGVDALTMGWGHLGKYKEDLNVNSNVDTIKYTPTKILEKEKCLSYFTNYKQMLPVIKAHMICTLEAGNLDDGGRLILRSPPALPHGCIPLKDQLLGLIGRTCDGEENESETRKELHNDLKKFKEERKNQKNVLLKDDTVDNETLKMLRHNEEKAKEAPGICQNDHGGPLVTWEGSHEVLIGVATLYKVDDDSNCIGPYLFTSTHCAAAFLQCILSLEDDTDTGRRCKNTDNRKLEISRRHISWENKDDQ